jgi:uncharacterized protein YukE
MSVRVLSTDEGKAAIGRVQTILGGGLAEQIAGLRAQGSILSDPNIWDGLLAEEFRSETWPAASTALQQTAEALDQLRAGIQAINTDIMSAGGNAY